MDLEAELNDRTNDLCEQYGNDESCTAAIMDTREAIADWLRERAELIAAPHVVGAPLDTVTWVAGLIDPLPADAEVSR